MRYGSAILPYLTAIFVCVVLQALSHQRPAVAVMSPTGTTLPADVVASVQCRLPVVPGQPEGGVTLDLFLLQWYEFALGPGMEAHPFVPSCKYVVLTNKFVVLPVTELMYPVKLVPNVGETSTSTREPALAHARFANGDMRFPAFFWLPDLL